MIPNSLVLDTFRQILMLASSKQILIHRMLFSTSAEYSIVFRLGPSQNSLVIQSL